MTTTPPAARPRERVLAGEPEVRRVSPHEEGVSIPFVIAGERDVPDRPVVWEPHTHPVHEMLWVTRGVMTVHVDGTGWTLPTRVALWIPAGVEHSGSLAADSDFHAAYFDPARCSFAPAGPECIELTPLLHELLSYTARQGTEEDDAEQARLRSNAEELVFGLLSPSSRYGGVSLGAGRGVSRVTAALLERPDDERTLEEWAAEAGVGARTLARAFVAETGRGFSRWRRDARMHVARALLLSGVPVAETAERVGYRRASSFIEVFTAEVGVTPGVYRRGERDGARRVSFSPY